MARFRRDSPTVSSAERILQGSSGCYAVVGFWCEFIRNVFCFRNIWGREFIFSVKGAKPVLLIWLQQGITTFSLGDLV